VPLTASRGRGRGVRRFCSNGPVSPATLATLLKTRLWNLEVSNMKLAMTSLCAALALAMAASAPAQIKEMAGDAITKSGVVEAIDYTSRVVTLKNKEGELVTLDVPADMKRFSEIKVGDTVTARYYDNVTVRLKKPGEAAVNTSEAAATRGTGAKPAGTAAVQRTMTAEITAIDPKVPSITFKGPQNWSYSRRVLDKNVLKQVKVGDKVDFTWTEALQIEITAPKK
jgi:Cu/Ag efflux protein CusF